MRRSDKTRKYFYTSLFAVATIAVVFACLSFERSSNTKWPSLISDGYPRAFFFRRSENMIVAGYENWEKTFIRLGGIMGKTQNEEIVNRKTSLPFFQKFKQKHPEQAVFLHYNGNGRDPLEGEKFFAGHWLYYEGTPLLESINDNNRQVTIKVKDAAVFKMKTGRLKNKNDELAICALNENGSPDWNYAEQLTLADADYANNTITVNRGRYGTRPLRFEAGKSIVLPHAVEGPWGNESNLLWLYNHSSTSPKDKNGKTCDDILIEDIASKFKTKGELSMFDGVEFDVLWNELKNENNLSARKIDVDGDGKGDNGIVNGVNVYSIGVFDFCRNFRDAMGPDKMIMADGMTYMFQRGVGYLNGIESEGWPHLKDPEVSDWSGGWNRHLFWNENSFRPAFSFINFKYAQNIIPAPLGRQRLVWAVSQLLDASITGGGYILEKPVNGIKLAINDEFVAGDRQQKSWLGFPKGPAVRLALHQPDLLKDKGRNPDKAFLNNITGENLDIKLDKNAIRIQSAKKGNLKFSLKDIPASGPDLMVSLKIRCDPRIGYPAKMPRLLHVSYDADPQRNMSFCNDKWFTATFYFRDVKEDKLSLLFDLESNESLLIKDITAHAYPDVVFRVFDNGVVLANPSLHPFTFDLAKVAPGIKLHRLQGTESQDRITNNGQPVGDKITIAEREGLFLQVDNNSINKR